MLILDDRELQRLRLDNDGAVGFRTAAVAVGGMRRGVDGALAKPLSPSRTSLLTQPCCSLL